MKYPNRLQQLALCHVVLIGACSIDSALSPEIPQNAVTNADDEDAGADLGSRRAAKKVAPAPAPRDSETAANPDPHAPERGPYYEDGPWNGYLWVAKTGKDTTLSPSQSFEDKAFTTEVCIKGSVGASPDSSGNAMLGMNISQAERTDAVPLALVPRLAGVQIDLKNKASSPLRVQLAAQDGTSNADARWCAAVSGAGGFVPWSAFNTACWDGSGKPYKLEPITVAMLLVPGNAQAALPYDVCLQRLVESDAPKPGVGAGAAPPDDN